MRQGTGSAGGSKEDGTERGALDFMGEGRGNNSFPQEGRIIYKGGRN